MHDSAPQVSLLLPTRNRPDTLQRTLSAIAALELHAPCELVVVDNASDVPLELPDALANGVPVTLLRLQDNEGAAARNRAAHAARAPWLLMLDDDSHPLGAGFLDVIASAPRDVAAIGAEITLPSGKREDGGLPEVIIGCGALIRRDAFLTVGGYDPAFQYYVEEYDLCAKLMHAGWHITHDRRFRALHEKVTAGRDMNLILHRLVRNNGWVLARHAPGSVREGALQGTIERYRAIAQRENGTDGFKAGLAELEATLAAQPRTPLSLAQHDRFTGLAAAREALHAHPFLQEPVSVALIEAGKHAWAVRSALEELPNVTIVEQESAADIFVIGTLSPGPMLDAFERRNAGAKPVLLPCDFDEPTAPQRVEHRQRASVR